jgi:hypothetical protein
MHRYVLLSLSLLVASSAVNAQTPEQTEFFEKKVRPLLAANCQGCHNSKLKTSGLDLSTSEGFFHGGPSGSLFSKDDPKSSLLLQVTSYEGKLKMPPMGKLRDEDLAVLKTWVESGAAWPGATVSTAPKAGPGGRQITDEDRNFWAFRPVSNPQPPAVKNAAWAVNPIDRFVLARLEEKSLKPAPPADKLALLRRVSYDVTGLPPTEQEIQSFLADKSPDAYTKVVDRLLASPRYGEHWGRHWLDVARYADSTGNDEDHRYPHAWRYRDYVIDAFNSDMPYNQFVREQIAGDLLPPPEGSEVNRRGIVATGFLALGAKAIAQQDKKKMLYDVYDEQVDVTSKAIMGVTLACARCHDHKFDPLLTKDYYSMISMFASTKSFSNPETHVSQLLFTPLAPKKEVEAYERQQQRIANNKAAIEDLIDEQIEAHSAPLLPRLADYMVAARRVYADKADAAAVAKEQNLQPAILAKWIEYLKPNGEVRLQLERWEKATSETAPEVAKSYQSEFDKHYSEWSARVKEWRTKFRALTDEERAMKAPEKPGFEPAKGLFFYETYIRGPFSVAKADRDKILSADIKTKIAALRSKGETLKAALPPEPDMACAVQEGQPVQQKVFVRGDYNSPGPDAPKAFPVVMMRGEQPVITKGSGRLELADWLARPDHPLTARVMVNRIWNWNFGEGIVRTPDNFGKMGERPTHPELLDYLATEFVRGGWSVKKIQRMILLSNTYQMSTAISDQAMETDPENRLYSRFPRRRLSVEEIRDGLLAIDGSLDYTEGGTLQKGTGTDGENSSGRLSLRPETSKRRLVYLPLRRANLPTLLNLFDFGDATTTSGKRALTTVAPQALFMMNSDFVTERAKSLAQEVAAKYSADTAARVRSLYLRVLNRPPAPDELDIALSYVNSFTTKFAGKRTESDAWFSFARVLIASNEFIYLD